jgi:hypothetical protein
MLIDVLYAYTVVMDASGLERGPTKENREILLYLNPLARIVP